MAAKVPSTMGTLMANGMMTAGKQLKGRMELDNDGICSIMECWQEGVTKMGKAKEGEKTFLDGIAPAVRAMKEMSNQDTKVMAAEGAKRQNREQRTQLECWQFTEELLYVEKNQENFLIQGQWWQV